MIIKGPEIHKQSWSKLWILCKALYAALQAAEEKLGGVLWDKGLPIESWDLHYRSYERVESHLIYSRNYLETIAEKIKSKNPEDLRDDFQQFFEAAIAGFADVEYFYDEVEDILNILEIEQGTLLYTPNRPLIEIPKLIVSVSDDLLKTLARNPNLLYSLHPRKFEEVIAEIFFKNGFEVELTKATRDGGKDIIAIYNKMNISTKYIIECKRYSKERKISLAIVQRLLGVKIASAANKAILATTSSFTRDAILFTSNNIWDLELKDYNDIVFWLKTCI
jgi:restriction system protein